MIKTLRVQQWWLYIFPPIVLVLMVLGIPGSTITLRLWGWKGVNLPSLRVEKWHPLFVQVLVVKIHHYLQGFRNIPGGW